MKSRKDIKQKLQNLVNELPEANQGMPAHLIREKIRLLKWVIE